MLVQFSVENFRVFDIRQTFSMVADSNIKRDDPIHVAETGFRVAPQVHHQASIFGANGAGKTSLFKAIAFMKHFVRRSFLGEPSDLIMTERFAYKEKNLSEPSVFEIVFIDGDLIYEYGFAVTPERVEEEWLSATPKDADESSDIFSREYSSTEPDDFKWYFNPDYIVRDQELWRNSTRPNALFLSTAVRFNLKILIKVFDWITKHIVFIDLGSSFRLRRETARLCLDGQWKKKILRYFDRLDVELDDIQVEEVKRSESSSFGSVPNGNDNGYQEAPERQKTYEVSFVRKNEDRIAVSRPISEESTGVIALFDMAGCLLRSLEQGFAIFIDEVNLTIHPLVFRELVSTFDRPEDGYNSAQLVFTSHDATLPEHESIDKDQVWFIRKETNFSSDIYSYSECRDNSDLPYHRKYFRGDFGAIPLIP